MASDLPRRTTLRRGRYYTYRRPDNDREIGLGTDPGAALALAEEMNRLFGVQAGQQHRKANYHLAFVRNVSALGCSDAVRMRLGDLFTRSLPKGAPPAPQSAPKRYGGRMWVKVADIRDDKLPVWASGLFHVSRRNAERRGVPFELTEADVAALLRESHGFCQVTGVRLRLDTVEVPGRRGKRPWAPSIDRRDNALGYTRGNCRIVCVAANLAMGVWGEEVLLTMAESIDRLRKEAGRKRE